MSNDLYLKGVSNLQMFLGEEWKVIQGYPSYEISNYGRIYSHYVKRLLSPYCAEDYSLHVYLYRNRTREHFAVHRLVMQHFRPDDWDPVCVIAHKDGYKTNNYVDNLECVDGFRNMDYFYAKDVYGGRPVKIVEWDRKFPNVSNLAGFLGGDKSSIYKCLRGERKKHLGLTFEYID